MENLEICRECGGTCCKRMGCHYSPKDFKDLSFEGLKKEIDKGYISIDWWEGNPFDDDREIPKAMFLRVRNIDSTIVDPAWTGRCSLLTETGCPLSYEDRPYGGTSLVPIKDGRCVITYDKQQCAIEWYEYNDVLIELEKHYYNDDNDRISYFEKVINDMKIDCIKKSISDKGIEIGDCVRGEALALINGKFEFGNFEGKVNFIGRHYIELQSDCTYVVEFKHIAVINKINGGQ